MYDNSKKLTGPLLCLILLFGLLVCNVFVSFGITSPGWIKHYGEARTISAHTLVQTGDGGYALAGSINNVGTGYSNFWLGKTDLSGSLLWNKTYRGEGFDYAQALVHTSDGGYALAGATEPLPLPPISSKGPTYFPADYWLVNTDSYGNVQWNKTYGGKGDDIAGSLIQTGDGGYALLGYTDSYGGGIWLVKTDSSGNMQWRQNIQWKIQRRRTFFSLNIVTGDMH